MLASELVTVAARLVRAVRNEGHYPAPQVRVLSIIDERGPSRVTTLATIDQCSQPTMTGTVNNLEQAGLVTREPDPADARAQLVHLTERGARELLEYRRQIGSIVLGWATGAEADLRAATEVLNRLVLASGGSST